MESPFWHYNTRFDAPNVIRRYEEIANPIDPFPGFCVNFLGVIVDPKILPGVLESTVGTVEAVPLPANWHADIAEWGAALRAVDLSGSQFTIVELGCGWGCWMNITGVAARLTGRRVHMIGIEGDRGHLQFAKEAFERNQFADKEWTLVPGIAAGKSGKALFPVQDHAGASWGLEPVFDASPEDVQAAVESGRFEIMDMVRLADVVQGHDRIDLLHIDIQGGEVGVVRDCLDLLNEKVVCVLIGTHSRQIEGQLFDIMLATGWRLDMERPAIITLEETPPRTLVDGVQSWLNPKFVG